MNSNIKLLITIFLVSAIATFSTISISIPMINANAIKIGEFSPSGLGCVGVLNCNQESSNNNTTITTQECNYQTEVNDSPGVIPNTQACVLSSDSSSSNLNLGAEPLGSFPNLPVVNWALYHYHIEYHLVWARGDIVQD